MKVANMPHPRIRFLFRRRNRRYWLLSTLALLGIGIGVVVTRLGNWLASR
jgi:hypothetical protein